MGTAYKASVRLEIRPLILIRRDKRNMSPTEILNRPNKRAPSKK